MPNKADLPWFEDAGFRAYAIAHYREAVQLAMAVRDAEKIPLGAAEEYNQAIFAGVLDKTLTPLVYLRSDYERLSLEQKEKWNPELKGATEKAAEISRKAAAMLTGANLEKST